MLRSKTWILILFVIMIIFSGCNSAKQLEVLKEVSAVSTREEQWIEDLDYLRENLEKKHKNLYHSISKQNFEKEIVSLKKDISNLKDYEVNYRLAQIIASVGDAHTALSMGFAKDKFYPIRLWWFDGELRVISTHKDHKDILGKKLIEINGISVQEIIEKVNSLISHENEQWLMMQNIQYITIPDVLKFLKVTSEDKIELSLNDNMNNISKVEMYPQIMTNENVVHMIDEMPVKPLRLQYNIMDDIERLYWYKYIPEDRILYFQYNQCIDREVAKRYGYKNYEDYPDFNEFSEELLKMLAENNIDKFIVDLRFNTGGDSSLMSRLVSKLSKIDKLKDDVKIFVMVGRETFSSGIFAALDFKNTTKAIFYGEPTGGNVNGYGDIKMLTLPNSKLSISYSTKHFQLSDMYKKEFIPDIIVNQSFENYKKGIDDVYEAIVSKH